MALDGADWCQLITVIAIPVVCALVTAVVWLARMLHQATEAHLKDLRSLTLSAKKARETSG